MAFNNSVNASQQGTQYLSTTGVWTGIDASTSGNVLTSNGTGIAPSFQGLAYPANSAFTARLSTTVANVTGDGTSYLIIFDTVQQTGSAYNTGTGLFTAPATGYYQFNMNIVLGGITVGNPTLYGASINGVITERLADVSGSGVQSATELALSASKLYYLNAGDTLGVLLVSGSGGQPKNVGPIGGVGYACTFSGFRVA